MTSTTRILRTLPILALCLAALGLVQPASGDLPVTNGLALWVDASQLTGLADGQRVDTWTDMSGASNDAIRGTESSTGFPHYVEDVVNGLPVVRFNSANNNPGDYFRFSRISTIRTVFWVLKENAGLSNGHFLLGDDSSHHFSRGGASGNGPIWDVQFTHPNITNGTTKLMGLVVDGTTTLIPAEQFQLISLVTVGDVQANQVTQDRTFHGSWQGDIAEIIVYTRPLQIDEVFLVETYLSRKYWGGVYITNDMFSVVAGADIVLAGTNSGAIVGDMWISNAANNTVVPFAAPIPASDGWTSQGVPAVYGNNNVWVLGTNSEGHVASDMIAVTGVPEPAAAAAVVIGYLLFAIRRRDTKMMANNDLYNFPKS